MWQYHIIIYNTYCTQPHRSGISLHRLYLQVVGLCVIGIPTRGPLPRFIPLTACSRG